MKTDSNKEALTASFSTNRWPQLAQLLDPASLNVGARTFVAALASQDDLPERLAHMAHAFRSKGEHKDAQSLAKAALQLAPDNYRVRTLTEWIKRKEAPLWHFEIIHDAPRNEAYAQALMHHVRPGMVVFEVGAGTGLLAMLAVRAGAAHVYTCERRLDVAETAREIIARNGMSDRITVIAKDVDNMQLGVDLPQRADLFVAELLDNHLLGENVLPITETARARFLKPDAILLPQHIALMGALVSGKNYQHRYHVETVMGFDLSPFNRFTPISIHGNKGGGAELLSAGTEIQGFDLTRDVPVQGRREVTLCANQSGIAEGIMSWIKLDFGNGIVFENKPPQVSSWNPTFHVLPQTMPVQPGEVLTLEVSHTRDRIFLVPRA